MNEKYRRRQSYNRKRNYGTRKYSNQRSKNFRQNQHGTTSKRYRVKTINGSRTLSKSNPTPGKLYSEALASPKLNVANDQIPNNFPKSKQNEAKSLYRKNRNNWNRNKNVGQIQQNRGNRTRYVPKSKSQTSLETRIQSPTKKIEQPLEYEEPQISHITDGIKYEHYTSQNNTREDLTIKTEISTTESCELKLQPYCDKCGLYNHTTSFCRLNKSIPTQRKKNDRHSKSNQLIKESERTYKPPTTVVTKVSTESTPFFERKDDGILEEDAVSIDVFDSFLTESSEEKSKEAEKKRLEEEEKKKQQERDRCFYDKLSFTDRFCIEYKAKAHLTNKAINDARDLYESFKHMPDDQHWLFIINHAKEHKWELSYARMQLALLNFAKSFQENKFECKVKMHFTIAGPNTDDDTKDFKNSKRKDSEEDVRNDLKQRVDLKHFDTKTFTYKLQIESELRVDGFLMPQDMYEFEMEGNMLSSEGLKRTDKGGKIKDQFLTVSVELLAQVMHHSVMNLSTSQQDLWNKIMYAISMNNTVNISKYDFGCTELQTALFGFYYAIYLRQQLHLPFPKNLQSQKDMDMGIDLMKFLSLGLGLLKTKFLSILKG